MNRAKIALAVVENRDYINTEYCKMLTSLAWNRMVNINFWHERTRRSIFYMRREMIKKALESDITHLLFIDTDVIPAPGFIDKLLEHNLPMVSGVYYDQEGNPAARKGNELVKLEGLQEVDVFSMGLSLIERKVLETVEYPNPDPVWKLDADTEFCVKAKEKGFIPHVDFSVRGAHLLLSNC